MRLLLVGSSEARRQLRAELDNTSFTVAGEYATLRQARASGIEADGILVANGIRPSLTSYQIDPANARTNHLSIDGDSVVFAEPLTARETQVVELLAEGLSNKAIAARLAISDQTVKFHVASLSGKLGAANRTDAVRRAVRRGLISL